MTNLSAENLGRAFVQRARDVYHLAFMKMWWMLFVFIFVSWHRVNGVTFDVLQLLVLLFVGMSISLSYQLIVDKSHTHPHEQVNKGGWLLTPQGFVMEGWLLLCLVIIAGFNLPFSFRALLSPKIPFVFSYLIEACTLGVGANMLLLWLYSALEFTTMADPIMMLPILIKSFFEILRRVLFHPLAVFLFALNSLVVMLLHGGLVMLLDRIPSLYPHPGHPVHFVLMGLRIWVPFIVLTPWYTAVSAVVYEYISGKSHRDENQAVS